MNRMMRLTLLAAVCIAAPAVAVAQGTCPDGRTASGQCVNPLLAGAMRQAAVILSQPKLSGQHYPVLPSLDWIFRYPHQLNPNQQMPPPAGTPAIIP